MNEGGVVAEPEMNGGILKELARQTPVAVALIIVTVLFLGFMEKTAAREDIRLSTRVQNTERMSVALERSAAALDRNTQAIERFFAGLNRRTEESK